MTETIDADDGYDAAKNTFDSYSLAIRTIRLNMIRAGKEAPRLIDPEEVAVAIESGFHIVNAQHHRISA